MMTVGQQGGMILPVGLGMGATQLGKFTKSPRRAAGRKLIITEDEPFATIPGAPGTQVGIVQGLVMLVTTAAGRLPIITVVTVAVRMGCGIGGCGTGVGTGAAGCMGAWQCGASWRTLSVCRAAGGILVEVDHLAFHDDVAGGIDFDVGLAAELHAAVGMKVNALGGADFKILAGDVDIFRCLQGDADTFHLQDRALRGEANAEFQLTAGGVNLDEIAFFGGGYGKGAGILQV